MEEKGEEEEDSEKKLRGETTLSKSTLRYRVHSLSCNYVYLENLQRLVHS